MTFTHESSFTSGHENTAIGTKSFNFLDMESRGIAVDFVDAGDGYKIPQFRKMTEEELVAHKKGEEK